MSRKNSKKRASSRDCNGRFLKGVRSSRATEFKKGQHWRPPAPFRIKSYLIQEYIDKRRSAGEIAVEHGVTEGAIFFWLIKHKIPRRTISEARSAKHWGSKGEKNPMFGKCGDQNPRWIDGSSPERQKMYARCFWKEIAKAVYARDEYKCRRCGAKQTTKNKLHAHHVKPWAGNPKTRFVISNIITLCKKCHNWVHSKANAKNEYLSSR